MYLRISLKFYLVLAIHFPSTHPSEKFHVSYRSWSLTRIASIGLVLGPSTALYGPFLKHCTLTNKAVGTIWRALSKPPQRRQGPDLCPLWLLVGTPSAIKPELASRRAEHSLPYSDLLNKIFITYAVCVSILWHLRLVWLLVCCLYKEVFTNF